MSSKVHATNSNRPEIAALGIIASNGADKATSTTSNTAENTAANGVFAPASYPCPVNSRLASMRWPERVAPALAMEIDCARAPLVSAKARLSRSGSVRQSTLGT
ncbi:hypothetical protein G6F24_016785 [Rhizopus arrhizus]|nr:hypothetical protein G6F24_016785 [Rhizopus arrhizus]